MSFSKRTIRRIRANVLYLRKPLGELLPQFALLGVVLVSGSICFHFLGTGPDGKELDYPHSLFVTFTLIFAEYTQPFPDHPALQVFYFVLPLLGLVVILDAIVRFGYYVLRRDETGTLWIRAMARTYSGHVVLCGLGKVGLRVLQQLLRLGEDVVVLEKNPDNPNIAFARRHGVPVLVGTGREEGILNDLNVAHAKSLIAATDDDLANLEIALDARKIKSNIRVVMRLFDQELASKIRESFDIDLAFSTSALAAPVFATASSDRSIVNSFYVGEELLVVARLVVNPGSKLIGKTIRDIKSEHSVFFLAHQRRGFTTNFPAWETVFEEGDQITIQTEPATLKVIHRANLDPEPY
jgi:Trk K+ transport system NAD-binding subunit